YLLQKGPHYLYYLSSVPRKLSEDGESGWSSLHRALHFGHLCIAGVLLQFGASLALEDTKGRTPNILVVSKYYSRVTIKRLDDLLCLSLQ
ncbi:hypothetical protein ACJX0J_011287, partial [Zea mays]